MKRYNDYFKSAFMKWKLIEGERSTTLRILLFVCGQNLTKLQAVFWNTKFHLAEKQAIISKLILFSFYIHLPQSCVSRDNKGRFLNCHWPIILELNDLESGMQRVWQSNGSSINCVMTYAKAKYKIMSLFSCFLKQYLKILSYIKCTKINPGYF